MSRTHWISSIAAAGVFALALPAAAAAQDRFHGLDRNRDGVITRAEWRGSDTSFRQHDRNRDGVITGIEARSVPIWDARDGRWKRYRWDVDRWDDTGRERVKVKVKAKPAKSKAAKPAKGKPAKPAKPRGGKGGH